MSFFRNRTNLTILLGFGALLSVGCSGSNPSGCKDNPGTCGAGTVCDSASNQCVTPVVADMGGSKQMCSTDGWCVPVSLPQADNLFGLGGVDAGNVWAVGAGGTILHWNGVSWTVQTSGTTNELRGLWGLDAGNVWAVGTGGTILKRDYDSPIGTYIDRVMETPGQTFTPRMSAFSARRATLIRIISDPDERPVPSA